MLESRALRIITALAMLFLLVFFPINTIQAENLDCLIFENDNYQIDISCYCDEYYEYVIIPRSQEEIERDFQKQWEDHLISIGENPNSRSVARRFVGSGMEWSGHQVAGNQNPCGFNHGPSGGSISWNGTGGGSVSISLGLSISGFGGSVSIARGRAGVTGHSINVPVDMRNQNVLLQINHEVYVRVYETRGQMDSNWSTIVFSSINSQRARIVRSGC